MCQNDGLKIVATTREKIKRKGNDLHHENKVHHLFSFLFPPLLVVRDSPHALRA